MHLTFHYDVFKFLLASFLLLFILILCFTPLAAELFFVLAHRAFATVQPKTGKLTKEEREEARRERKRLRAEGSTQRSVFKWFCISGVTCLFINLLLPDNLPYRFPDRLFVPMLCTGLTGGFLVIFIGPTYMGQRRAWAQWTYWLSVVVALIPVWELSRWLQPRRGGGLMFVWVLGVLLFFLVSGALRRAEVHERSLKSRDV